MFRVAALRTVARAAVPKMTTRTLVSAAAKPSFRVAVAPKMGMAVRFYSAGGALDKTQVEGRIMSLLQGFDKVSLGF